METLSTLPVLSGADQHLVTWQGFDMKTFVAKLALCEENPKITSGFPTQKVTNAECDVSFVVTPNDLFIK